MRLYPVNLTYCGLPTRLYLTPSSLYYVPPMRLNRTGSLVCYASPVRLHPISWVVCCAFRLDALQLLRSCAVETHHAAWDHWYLLAQKPAPKTATYVAKKLSSKSDVVLILQQTCRESLLVISLFTDKILVLFRFMITSDDETIIFTCIPWSAAYEELPYIVLRPSIVLIRASYC
jgi:hypothetical protein